MRNRVKVLLALAAAAVVMLNVWLTMRRDSGEQWSNAQDVPGVLVPTTTTPVLLNDSATTLLQRKPIGKSRCRYRVLI